MGNWLLLFQADLQELDRIDNPQEEIIQIFPQRKPQNYITKLVIRRFQEQKNTYTPVTYQFCINNRGKNVEKELTACHLQLVKLFDTFQGRHTHLFTSEHRSEQLVNQEKE